MAQRSGSASWLIEMRGLTSIKRAMRVLAEKDAPFIKAALAEAGGLLRTAAARRAPGKMASAVAFVGVRGSGASVRAQLKVTHGGAKAREFGRSTWYRGYTGRHMKATGHVVKHLPGQRPQPFLGIIHQNAAIAEVKPQIEKLLGEAFENEWMRITSEGD